MDEEDQGGIGLADAIAGRRAKQSNVLQPNDPAAAEFERIRLDNEALTKQIQQDKRDHPGDLEARQRKQMERAGGVEAMRAKAGLPASESKE